MNKNSTKKTLTIGHLYAHEMNLYGDIGNIITLEKRCQWRGIQVNTMQIGAGENWMKSEVDLYFFGGGQDKDQLKIYPDLIEYKQAQLEKDLSLGKPLLAICGGYQLLGTHFLASNGDKIQGLGILPLATVAPSADMTQRAVGNVVTRIVSKRLLKNQQNLSTIVGFENHSGRTKFNKEHKQSIAPLGKIIHGIGDNFDDPQEGIVYGNIIGSYCHGPILPKNPHIADFLIEKALEVKYGYRISLTKLNDKEELAAHNYLVSRFIKR